MEFINVDNSSIIKSANFNGDNNNNIYNEFNCDRTDINHTDSFQNTTTNINSNTRNIGNSENNDNNINIYRYKFSNDFTNELFKFSKVHQYDHRKDFKDAWEIWMEENQNLVDGEVRRLINLGYEGNVIDKMFKSARYYFRKKKIENNKEPQKRRVYQNVQKELLEQMDEHIKINIQYLNC